MTYTNRFGTPSELGSDGICRAVRQVEMPRFFVLNQRFGHELSPHQKASRDAYEQAEKRWIREHA